MARESASMMSLRPTAVPAISKGQSHYKEGAGVEG